MNRLSKIAAEMLYQLGISPHFRQNGGRFVLAFHGVSAKRLAHLPDSIQPQHSAEELQQTLAWLQQFYTFLRPEDFFAGRAGVLLSFDDGFANNYYNALSVLEKFHAPAIFFVASQHVQDPSHWFAWIKQQAQYWEGKVPDEYARDFYNGMSEAELIAASQHPLITIGAHTHSHPILTEIDAQAMDYELNFARRYLENLIQKPVDYFAYPKGILNTTVAVAVKNAGYKAAFSLKIRLPELENYSIPRIDLYDASPAYLTLKLSQKPL